MYDYASDIFNRLSESKQIHILDSIVEAFGYHGFAAISLRGMSDLTGISTGSLYQYFQNKEGMLNAATNYVFDRMGQYAEPIERSSGEEIMHRLTMFIDTYDRIATEFPQGLRFFNKLACDEVMAEQYYTLFYERTSFLSVAWDILLEFKKTYPDVEIDIVNFAQILSSIVFTGEMLSVMRFQRIRNSVFLGPNFDDLQKVLSFQKKALATILAKGGYRNA